MSEYSLKYCSMFMYMYVPVYCFFSKSKEFCKSQLFKILSRIHAFETLFSKINLQFQIISNTVRIHSLDTLFSKCSLQFQIVSNTIAVHALDLETLFSHLSLQFQIVLNTIIMHSFRFPSYASAWDTLLQNTCYNILTYRIKN